MSSDERSIAHWRQKLADSEAKREALAQKLAQADRWVFDLADQCRVLTADKADLGKTLRLTQSRLDELRQSLDNRLDRLTRRYEEALSQLESEREDHNAIKDASTAKIAEMNDRIAASEQQMKERFREIVALTRVIQERDQILAEAHGRIEWMRRVISVLTRGFSTSGKARLLSWLPSRYSQKRHKYLLKEQGLFDPDAYTSIYPDVVDSKADPLRHYINHGLQEGRKISRDK
ncbi:hypothetical protein CJD35_22105 (plasmid) [Sphingobium xenophagum]|uniref:Uncharacterized protein n=1 Tax=Sphingobium xenophagum TaxID=121428 RepID=A0A249N1E0_SPHXE|nr:MULTISPECIES: hypothetical protein [Sphingobium]ASY47159.1 hypothetical protein CJD35_22105 [Sphingobium xenophagum]MBG6120996.1 chromosome segregation ATPase [Sphingobium sp. JAI105]